MPHDIDATLKQDFGFDCFRPGQRISDECATCTGFYRENLTLQATPVAVADRDELLRDRLRHRDAGATMVYVTLQRTAEEVAERLTSAGFSARAYHAGMKGEVSCILRP